MKLYAATLVDDSKTTAKSKQRKPRKSSKATAAAEEAATEVTVATAAADQPKEESTTPTENEKVEPPIIQTPTETKNDNDLYKIMDEYRKHSEEYKYQLETLKTLTSLFKTPAPAPAPVKEKKKAPSAPRKSKRIKREVFYEESASDGEEEATPTKRKDEIDDNPYYRIMFSDRV